MSSVTLYQAGDSFFHRCDSRTKLALIISFAGLAFLYFNPLVPFCLTVAALALNFAATGRYALTNSLTKTFLVIIFFFLVIHGFANPAGITPASFFGFPLAIPYFGAYTLEGAYFGLTFGFRVAAVALIALLYVSTTHPADVVKGLVKLGLPYKVGFMILMSLQLIPISTREVQIILSAQRARGLMEKTLLDKLKGLVPLFVPLVVSSLERMETLAMALETRGFGYTPQPTSLRDVRFSGKDIALIAAAVLVIAGGVLVRFQYGSLNWINQLSSWTSIFWPAHGGW